MDRFTVHNSNGTGIGTKYGFIQSVIDDCRIGEVIDKLGVYEDTRLTPEEIKDREETLKAYRHVCGGKSPEEIRELQQKRDCWKNEAVSDKSKLGLLRLWFGSNGMDMDNALEEISKQVK